MGAKRYSKSCHNHGDCPWCLGNRQYNYKKLKIKLDDDFKSWMINE